MTFLPDQIIKNKRYASYTLTAMKLFATLLPQEVISYVYDLVKLVRQYRFELSLASKLKFLSDI